jgi:hypothetical protein
MIVKNLTVGKGLQAYRLFSQPPAAAPAVTDTSCLTPNEVHRIFYDRLMTASEKVSQRAASATPACPDVHKNGSRA